MINKVKDVTIKKQSYCFFNDTIRKENSDEENIKIDEKSSKILLFTILDMWLSIKTWK